MAERNANTVASYALGSIGARALFLLSISLVGCILVIVWLSRRARYTVGWCRLQSTPERTGILADEKGRHAELLDPLDAMESGQLLPPLTSGYLAAQAEMKRSAGTTSGPNILPMGEIFKPATPIPLSEAETIRTPLDQQVPWRRHSYPSAEKQDGLLHDTSTQDATSYLPDEVDHDIVWRRRTLVFEGRR